MSVSTINCKAIFQWLLLLIFSVLFFAFILAPNIEKLNVPSLYMARDIRRSIEIYFAGKWFWMGPDLSGGGYLPGPFFYFLIGSVFYFFKSISAVFCLEVALGATSAVVLWNHICRKYSETAAVIYFFCFLNSLFFLGTLVEFWNPSFIFLFLLVSFALLNGPAGNARLACAGLLLGLCLQIHLTGLILIIGYFVFVLTLKTTAKKKLHKLLLVGFFALLPQIPFFIQRVFNHQGFSDLAAALQTFTQHIASPQLRPDAVFNWLGYFSREVFFLPSLLCLAFLRQKDFGPNKKFIFILAAISSSLSIWILYGAFLSRYLISLFLFGSLFLAIKAAEMIERSRRFRFTFIFLLVPGFIMKLPGSYSEELFKMTVFEFIFLGLLLFLTFILACFFFRTKYAKATFLVLSLTSVLSALFIKAHQNHSGNSRNGFSGDLSMHSANLLLRKVIETTGWSYVYFREHTFVKGIDRELDLSLTYELLLSEISHSQVSRNYDGLLVYRESLFDNLPEFILKALETGQISCDKNLKTEGFNLCFYSFTKGREKLRWNNIGYAYLYKNTPDFFVEKSDGILQVGPNEAVFYINSCNDFKSECSVFFRLRLLSSQLYVEVTGDPLAAVDPAVNPAWVLSLYKPLLNFDCRGKKVSIPIAQHLGFEAFRNSVLAPFDNTYALPCSRPSSIRLEFSDGENIFRNYTAGKLPAYQLVWNLDSQ